MREKERKQRTEVWNREGDEEIDERERKKIRGREGTDLQREMGVARETGRMRERRRDGEAMRSRGCWGRGAMEGRAALGGGGRRVLRGQGGRSGTSRVSVGACARGSRTAFGIAAPSLRGDRLRHRRLLPGRPLSARAPSLEHSSPAGPRLPGAATSLPGRAVPPRPGE